jgi:hypothetical protein
MNSENLSPVGESLSPEARQEQEAIELCDRKMHELSTKHPAWFELYDETLPDNAPRAEVVELMATAPTDFAIGLLYGKFTMRLELEAITGRPFA